MIALEQVEVTREGQVILGPLSLGLPERRIGVIGRNGSGKSTLARVLSGLIASDAGKIRVAGVDVWKDRRSAVKTVGILFQNPDHQIIFPTVAEELGFGLAQMGLAAADVDQRVEAILTRFSKAHWSDRAIQTLSQGQRHLVCLMAVLAMEPKLILLDEPFAGLDLPTKRALNAYLAGLAPAIVHITHDLEAIADYDRAIWLEKGLVAGDGTPTEVIAAYRSAMDGGSDDLTDLTD